MPNEKYSLFEVNEYLRRALALNFSEALWVNCEIAQVNFAKGHYFLSLVEKNTVDDTIIAQSDAVIWKNDYLKIRKRLGTQVEQILHNGTQVLLQIQIDYHERYGLKFIIKNIDLQYTIGQLELKRQEILQRLVKEKLLEKNSTLLLPYVIQNIAVLSSSRAAGWKDFIFQIQHNPYQYQFNIELFESSMQGIDVEKDIIKQFKKIKQASKPYDVIVLIRGGGAKLDLMAFDNYKICKAIAKISLPVLTGIGHEIDETLADKVAHTTLKTPTAVADYIIMHNAHFEQGIQQGALRIQQLSQERIKGQTLCLQHRQQQIIQLSKLQVFAEKNRIKNIAESLPHFTNFILKAKKMQLKNVEDKLRLVSPEQVLKRGYSLVSKDGKLLKNSKEIGKGDEVNIQLYQGELNAEITSK